MDVTHYNAVCCILKAFDGVKVFVPVPNTSRISGCSAKYSF